MYFLNILLLLFAKKFKLSDQENNYIKRISTVNRYEIKNEYKYLFIYVIMQLFSLLKILFVSLKLNKKYKYITFKNKTNYDSNFNLYNIIIDNKFNITNKNINFIYCLKLNNVYIKNLKIIPNFCFYQCINLKKVVINKNTKIISSNAFEDCINLETIIIPRNITIQTDAFKNCIKLTKIIVY